MTISNFELLSWNIRRSGYNKATREDLMNVIVEMFKAGWHPLNGSFGYDIVALQEVVNPEFIRELAFRFDGENLPYSYRYTHSHHNGEYYVFFYNNETVEMLDSFQYPNKSHFFRPPYIGLFDIKGVDVAVINIHTTPQNPYYETRNLEYVTDAIRKRYDCKNIIIAGDLNCHPPYGKKIKFGMKKPIDFPGTSEGTNIRGDLAIDHIICDDSFNAQLRMLDAEVLNFKVHPVHRLIGHFFPEWLRLKMNEVSDHYPLEAKFAVSTNNSLLELLGFNAYVETAQTFLRPEIYKIR